MKAEEKSFCMLENYCLGLSRVSFSSSSSGPDATGSKPSLEWFIGVPRKRENSALKGAVDFINARLVD